MPEDSLPEDPFPPSKAPDVHLSCPFHGDQITQVHEVKVIWNLDENKFYYVFTCEQAECGVRINRTTSGNAALLLKHGVNFVVE